MKPSKIIRSNRKSISLQINENAELIVRAPHFVSMKKIVSFIDEKSDWIERSISKANDRIKLINSNSEFKDGKTVWFLGRRYSLLIQKSTSKIQLNEDYLYFPEKYLDQAKEQMAKWYKVQAKRLIVQRCMKIAQKLNMDISRVSITSAQKRWGSCTSRSTINFSYRLVMTPVEIIDYVIVHELMHLKEMNHSTKFWNHVESILPDYKNRRKWLRDNQHRLLI